jgi:branched-chain amino acid transport system ATP-binding protein
MARPDILTIRGLSLSYGGIRAVSGLDLAVPQGAIVALVGGNGAGKSSTLRAVAGLNRIDAGRIELEGRPIEDLPAHRRVALGMSLVPEGRRLFPRLSVERNLELGAFTRPDAGEIRATMQRVLELFPILAERRSQLAGTMSGGEQQMLAIARGLMARPRLLMLDEPSWGIAPRFVARVFDTIRQVHREGVSVLLVEQNVQRALEIADRAYVIQTGRIVMQGSGQELLGHPDIRKAYLGI